MNERIISAADMMLQAANINMDSANEICSVWKKVVSGVHSFKHDAEDSDQRMPLGERLAGNTRVIDLKNGVLLVEADHSGWIQYLRMYQNFILKGLKWSLPNLKISSLAFRVRGTEASLSDIYDNHFEKAQQQMDEKIEKTERELENRFGQNHQNEKNEGKLPQELFQKLENLKN